MSCCCQKLKKSCYIKGNSQKGRSFSYWKRIIERKNSSQQLDSKIGIRPNFKHLFRVARGLHETIYQRFRSIFKQKHWQRLKNIRKHFGKDFPKPQMGLGSLRILKGGSLILINRRSMLNLLIVFSYDLLQIEKKCKQYVNPKDEFEFSSHYNKFKDKNFTVEHDKLLVYFANQEGISINFEY